MSEEIAKLKSDIEKLKAVLEIDYDICDGPLNPFLDIVWKLIDFKTQRLEMLESSGNKLSSGLSEHVRNFVLEKSGTLAEISRVTGVPKTTLGGWLNGKKDLTTGVFDKVCEAYGIIAMFRRDLMSDKASFEQIATPDVVLALVDESKRLKERYDEQKLLSTRMIEHAAEQRKEIERLRDRLEELECPNCGNQPKFCMCEVVPLSGSEIDFVTKGVNNADQA